MSLLYFYYSRTEEISLDKNVTTEVTQDEKNEKEPSDEGCCTDRAQRFATECSNGCREGLSRWDLTILWLQLITFARTSFCLGKVLFKFTTSSADIGTDFLQSKFSIHFFKIKIKDKVILIKIAIFEFTISK